MISGEFNDIERLYGLGHVDIQRYLEVKRWCEEAFQIQGKQELELGFPTSARQIEHNRGEGEVKQRGLLIPSSFFSPLLCSSNLYHYAV